MICGIEFSCPWREHGAFICRDNVESPELSFIDFKSPAYTLISLTRRTNCDEGGVSQAPKPNTFETVGSKRGQTRGLLLADKLCYFNMHSFESAVGQKQGEGVDERDGDDVSVRLLTAFRLSDALFSTLIHLITHAHKTFINTARCSNAEIHAQHLQIQCCGAVRHSSHRLNER